MYHYVEARVLPKTLAAQWLSRDVSHEIVSSLYATYQRIVLVLLPDGGTENVYVDLVQLQAEYATYTNTLDILLQVLGERTLDTLPRLPDASVDYIVYSDAIRVGYKAQYASRGAIYPATFPKEEMNDLVVTRPNTATDVSLLHSHCLVSVNGYYHLTDTDGTQLWVVDGGQSVRHLNRNHFGITSFLKIGALTKQAFTDEMIQVANSYSRLKDRVSIKLPSGFRPASLMMVLGGYLVMPEPGVFYPVSDDEWWLDMRRLPYKERLLESRFFLNLDRLQLTPSELNSANLSLEEIWSDAVIRRYFQLSQSFLVGVDRANLFYNKKTLRQFNEPGLFTSIQEPTYPVVVGYGRTAEYWKVLEDRVWAVTMEDNFLRNYMFNELAERDLTNVTDQLENRRPFFISQGALLEIGAYGV